jgi:hypothetical protein
MIPSLLTLMTWVAVAQVPKPEVMPFPLELKRTPPGFSAKDAEFMQLEYDRLLKVAGAQVPRFAKYDTALKELKRRDCEREDECLKQLAEQADALYGLYVNLDLTLEGSVVATGRVVRRDGKTVRPTEAVKLVKGSDGFKDIAKNALAQLFAMLKIRELDPTRPVEAAKPPDGTGTSLTVLPPPPPPPILVVDEGATRRLAGQATMIGGISVAAIGGVLVGVGNAVGSGVTPVQGAIPRAQLDPLVAGSSLVTAGLVTVGIGAAAAVAGGVLWGLAKPAPSVVNQVSVVVTPSGGVLAIGGKF